MMKEDRKIIPEQIHVVDIKTLKGNIETGDMDEDLQKQVAGYRFQYSLGTGINIEDMLVALRLTVNIDGLDTDNIETGTKGSYTHSITFRVDNLSDFIDFDAEADEIREFDIAMGGTLVGIAYSTIRGIIYNRTQSTALNAVILPVINPMELLKIDDGNIK
jgi:hypothetical protein